MSPLLGASPQPKLHQDALFPFSGQLHVVLEDCYCCSPSEGQQDTGRSRGKGADGVNVGGGVATMLPFPVLYWLQSKTHAMTMSLWIPVVSRMSLYSSISNGFATIYFSRCTCSLSVDHFSDFISISAADAAIDAGSLSTRAT